jgi:menaquinone-dependent protoporphyrinogen oxidase
MQPELIDLTSGDRDVPASADGLLLAGPVHMSHVDQRLLDFAHEHHDLIEALPTAALLVCLSAASASDAAHAQVRAYADAFEDATGVRPTLVAGALAYRRYSPVKRRMMRHIARDAGLDTDTSRNWVYTDWHDVDAVADALVAAMRAGQARAG